MEEALQRSQGSDRDPQLKVSVLLDYTRGSRGCWRPPPPELRVFQMGPQCSPPLCVPGPVNSRTMLLPLLQRFTSQMRVSLYHTPDLRGLLRLLVPQRFNETIGVQHIKVYLFDDSVIISGYVICFWRTSCLQRAFPISTVDPRETNQPWVTELSRLTDVCGEGSGRKNQSCSSIISLSVVGCQNKQACFQSLFHS